MTFERWAPAGVALAGAGLVFIGSREWADDLPVVTAIGWATAAAGLLIWFVRAGLRRLVATIAALICLLALVVALTADRGAWPVLAVVVAGLGAALAGGLAIRTGPQPSAGAPRRVDPWVALDRGEDPTDVPPTDSEAT